jgi:hypothetical protein
MSPLEFNKLSFADQINFIFDNKDVKRISMRYFNNQKILLYDCGLFFVEFYVLQKEKKILGFWAIELDDNAVNAHIDYMNKSEH